MHFLARFILTGIFLLAIPAPLLAATTVVIDAGHGGHDRGGIPYQKYSEKEFALDVAKRVESRLRSRGFKTVMTRSSDYFVPLRTRCSIANSRGDIFISIHFNSAKNRDASGIETYYYGYRSGSLASSIHNSVLRATGAPDRHIRKRGFYVLRNTRTRAVLCELGFLTNAGEGKKCSSSSYRQKLADAIAKAVPR